jgi:hypothetical protein
VPPARSWVKYSLLSALQASSRAFSAPSAYCDGYVCFPEPELLAFLTGRLEALSGALAIVKGEMRGLDVPDALRVRS